MGSVAAEQVAGRAVREHLLRRGCSGLPRLPDQVPERAEH